LTENEAQFLSTYEKNGNDFTFSFLGMISLQYLLFHALLTTRLYRPTKNWLILNHENNENEYFR
jgi:hypothetical protein